MASEENSTEVRNEVFWRKLIIRYWYFILIFGILIAGAIAGFILTMKWYLETGMVNAIGGDASWTFNQFSMRTTVRAILFLCLWEFLFVFLPFLVIGGILVVVFWFFVLPSEVKEEVKMRSKKQGEIEEKKKRKNGGSGAFGLVMLIGLCIYFAVKGNWNTPFGSLNIGYFVNAWISVFIWMIIIIGIPGIIFAIIWFALKYGKEK